MRFHVLIAVLIVLGLSVECSKKQAPVPKAAEPAANVHGKITFLLGNASVTFPEKPLRAARLFLEIPDKSLIETRTASKIVISLLGLGDIAIGENSKIELSFPKSAAPSDAGAQPIQRTVIRNYQGSLFASIRKLTSKPQEFTIATPTATAAIRGTSFEVFVNPSTFAAEINVLKGTVAVRRNSRRVMENKKPAPLEADEAIKVAVAAMTSIVPANRAEPAQAGTEAPEAPKPELTEPEPPRDISLVHVGESMVIGMEEAGSEAVSAMSDERFTGFSDRVGDKVVKQITEAAPSAESEGVGVVVAAILDKPVDLIRSAAEAVLPTMSDALPVPDAPAVPGQSPSPQAAPPEAKTPEAPLPEAARILKEAVDFMNAPEPAAKAAAPVEAPNTAPRFLDFKPPAQLGVGQAVAFQLQARDNEGHALLFTLENAPEGLAITPFDGLITWQPETPGLFEFKVKVSDSKGLFSVKKFRFPVRQLIKASLESVTKSGIAGKTSWRFDASASRAEGIEQGLKYRFDFDGDRKFEFPGNDGWTENPITDHVFAKPGVYAVIMEAATPLGESSRASVKVTVDPHYPAEAKARPVAKANLAQVSEFDGEGSDKNGGIAEYLWDFDNNGSIDYRGKTAKASWSYGKAGSFTAVLKAVSADNDTGTAKVTAEVFNAPPSATACDDKNVKAGVNEAFTGKGADPDSKIEKYGWDFDGDGQVDWKSSFGAEVKYMYKKSGAFNAVLFVRTADGQMASDTVKVTVAP